MKSFSEFSGLSTHVLASLKRMQFEIPTPIQAQAIPLVLAGRDILGSAQTGTGKTGAFAIPMVSKLVNGEITGALILTPTRELASQVMASIDQILGKNSGIHMALLIGGEDIRRQFQQLKKQPRIIVGTPGRINDHIERNTVQLSKINYIVLDETDRMLDMGFGQQIDTIIAQVSPERQTLMFSATMPNNIAHMASKYLKNPERIAIGSCLKPVAAIQQETVKLVEDQKYEHLVKELTAREGAVVVFVKTKFGAKKIADRLYRDRFQAQAIHGNLRQNKRDQVIQGFKNKRFRILVATDVAARGLDVPHIELVINHDLPQCPEDYIHRIGRTARAGATGAAINFITPQDGRLWRAIERFMNTGEQGDDRNARPSRGGDSKYSRSSDQRRSGGRFSGSRDGGRRFGGDRPSFGGRSERSESTGGDESVRGDYAERSQRPARQYSSDRPARPFSSDRAPRPFSSDRSERPARFEYSADRAERPSRGGDYAERSERPARSYSSDRSEGGSSFGSDRAPRGEGRSERGGYRGGSSRSGSGRRFGGSSSGRSSFGGSRGGRSERSAE